MIDPTQERLEQEATPLATPTWPHRLARAMRSVVVPASRWSIVLGGAALVVMMMTVVADVTGRSGFGQSLLGTIDIVTACLVIVVFCGVAYAEVRRDHIQVTVITDRLAPTAALAVTTSAYMLAIAMAALIAWRTFAQADYLRTTNAILAVIDVPEWPFITVAGVFMTLFFLAVVVNAFDTLGSLLKKAGPRGYVMLIPGALVTLSFILFTLRPSLIPLDVAPGIWGVTITLLMFAIMFLGVPIALSMGIGATVGIAYLSNPVGSLTNISMSILSVASDYTWSVVPLFVWMGLLVFHAGFAKDLYAAAYRWVGHFPGGLASASVAACTGLAALVGDCVTGVLTMGAIALPQMRTYGYDTRFSTACICTAATIGILIPPSLGFIIYGMITEISIGKLFMAGILPGVLFALVLVGMITVRTRLNPALGPAGPVATWNERLASVRSIWGVVLLIVVVLGGLYLGLFTPTEAGAVGAFGALVIGVAKRSLSREGIKTSIADALRINCVILFIFLFAIALSRFLTVTRLPYELASSINALNLPPLAVLTVILLIYMFLGMIMNALPAVILTLPIFYPMVLDAGFDPIQFGVLVVVMVQLGTITPPIGVNVFAMSAIAKDVPMYSLFRGLLPFWLAFFIVVLLLIAFPEISLFLPSLM